MTDTKVFSFPENGNGGGSNDLATLLGLDEYREDAVERNEIKQ